MTKERRAEIKQAKKREREALRRLRYYLKWDRYRTGRDYVSAMRELQHAAEQRAFIEGLGWKES